MSWVHPDDFEQALYEALEPDTNLGQLCLALAPATRIEPLMLRNTRLKFCPNSDASLENTFWYGDFISSRSARSVTLYPGLARRLLEYAAGKDKRVLDYIKHIELLITHWHELDRVEFNLRLASLDALDHDADLESQYQTFFNYAYTLKQKRRDESQPHGEEYELARRIKGILPGYSDMLPDSPENGWLRQYASALLGDFSGDLVRTQVWQATIPNWLIELFPRKEVCQVRLQLFPGGLYCLEDDAEEGMVLGLTYSLPAPVRLNYDALGQRVEHWEHLRPNSIISLKSDVNELRITTLTGQSYVIKSTEGSVDGIGSSEIIYIEYSSPDAEMAWQLHDMLSRYGLKAEVALYDPLEKSIELIPEKYGLLIRLWSRRHVSTVFGEDDPYVWPFYGRRTLLVQLDETPLPNFQANNSPPLNTIRWGDQEDNQELIEVIKALLADETLEDTSNTVEETEVDVEALLAELNDPQTLPPRRRDIGDILAEIGDPRPGVGVKASVVEVSTEKDSLYQIEYIPDFLLDCKVDDLGELLPGPTLIHLKGEKADPLFVAVLLRGNDTSGFLAIQKLLSNFRSQELPRSISIFIGNIEAAKYDVPTLDHQEDYSRIWPREEYVSRFKEAKITHDVYREMLKRKPFASIHLFNQARFSPPYAIINKLNNRFCHLAGLFSRTVIYSLFSNGTQAMSFAEFCPSVSLECGEPGNQYSIDHAVEMLNACLQLTNIPNGEFRYGDLDIDLYHKVAEVRFNADIQVASQYIRFDPQFAHSNFQQVPAGSMIGRASGKLLPIDVLTKDGHIITGDYFLNSGNEIRLKKSILPIGITAQEKGNETNDICSLIEAMDESDVVV